MQLVEINTRRWKCNPDENNNLTAFNFKHYNFDDILLFPNYFLYMSGVQHRRLLLDLFSSSYKVKRTAVQARLAQELGDVSKADVDRVLHVRPRPAWRTCPGFAVVVWFFTLACCCLLQECCSSHAGMWYLKGTIESWHWAAVPSCTHPPHPPPGWEGSQVDDSQSELGQPQGQWSGHHQAVFFLFFFSSSAAKTLPMLRLALEGRTGSFSVEYMDAITLNYFTDTVTKWKMVFFQCTPGPLWSNLI